MLNNDDVTSVLSEIVKMGINIVIVGESVSNAEGIIALKRENQPNLTFNI